MRIPDLSLLFEQFAGGGGIHDECAEDFQVRVGQQRAEGLGARAAANAALAGHQNDVAGVKPKWHLVKAQQKRALCTSFSAQAAFLRRQPPSR